MAQESQGGRPNSGRGGNRKRRYFRRKPGDGATQNDAPAGTPEKADRSARSAPAAREGQPPRDSAGDRTGDRAGRSSGARRRRKSKGRRNGEAGRDPVVVQAQEIDYVPPTSVYIYTHIVRPVTGAAYEFRSEHFSKVGRSLEDYGVDVSPLFDEAARAAARPNMAEVFADFDMGEDETVHEPLPPIEHLDANLLSVGGDTGMPTYAEDPYGAEDTAPDDADEPHGTPDVATE